MRLIAALSILAGAAATATVVGLGAPSDTVAVVDGIAISRDHYDQYASVFTAPDGSLVVSREDVLASLVNQVLVQREADGRGLVLAGHHISDVIEEMEDGELLSPPGIIDEPAFRERVAMFLLFKLVRLEVVGPIDITREMMEAEYAADPSLQALGFSDATLVLRERLSRRVSDDRWADWLRSQRVCADVRIIDASFGVPSSTPAPECHTPLDV